LTRFSSLLQSDPVFYNPIRSSTVRSGLLQYFLSPSSVCNLLLRVELTSDKSLNTSSSMGPSHSKISYAISLSCQPISSESTHTISPIWDPRGPPPSPKTARNAPKNDMFSLVAIISSRARSSESGFKLGVHHYFYNYHHMVNFHIAARLGSLACFYNYYHNIIWSISIRILASFRMGLIPWLVQH